MLTLRIGLTGDELICTDGGATSRRRLDEAALARLGGWAADYDAAVREQDMPPLLAIGREIAALLNGGDGWLDARLRASTGDIALEVQVPTDPGPHEQALLDVPWELLATDGFFLAADAGRLFSVTRRLGEAAAPATPEHGDMRVLFMAAEVESEQALGYEREEAAIIQATRGLSERFHLAVEESGTLRLLGDRLALADRWEGVHLTCHANIAEDTPFLALETDEGTLDPVTPERLCDVLGDDARKPRLVVLSACRTAEQGGGGAASFIQALIRAGVANTLGWDGSVYDSDAIRFAEAFYHELAGGRPVAHAAAVARRLVLRALLEDESGQTGTHWHLARVYAGPDGGGILCDPTRPTRPRRHHPTEAFLDKAKQVPVATAAQFVGRRRAIQKAMRAWRDGSPGVLIQGMGNLGKSSLAERIASRHQDHTVVVVFKHYGPRAVFDALCGALPPRERAAFRTEWWPAVQADAAALQDALQELLGGPFSGHGGTNPILLIIDDLEQRLADPKPGDAATPFKTAEDEAVFGAILRAFRDAGASRSRLLITSRYRFALTDPYGDDLAAGLTLIALTPMDEVQRTKQMLTAAWLKGVERQPGEDPVLDALEARIRAAACGNPGLQEILTRPLLDPHQRPAGIADATRAVEAVERYLASGAVPQDDNTAAEFFRRVSLQAFRAMLTDAETAQLRAATLFRLPVPPAVLAAAGRAAGVEEPNAALDRLQGLGLLDRYGEGDAAELEVNPLARPLTAPPDDAEQATLAAAAVVPLHAAWVEEDGTPPWDPRSLELARLALLADGPPGIIDAASYAGGRYLFGVVHEARQALDLVTRAVETLERHGAEPDLHLLRLGAECAERLAHGAEQDRFLTLALARTGADPRAYAMTTADRGERLFLMGKSDEAERLLRNAVERFTALDDARSRAVTMGRIADILQARGELDEALRIHREELLPVFERLGDVRACAVTMGRIADILQARGELDEALRIRREEELPVFERLGDVRSRAVTMGQIADILQARGEVDEALRIRREEQLPVFERLGDVRERAVTMGKIADILQARGEVDEALRIRRDEQLPVFERLGDVRSRAVSMGRIADILQARGELDEALRIRREEELPVFERLGDVRERAVTLGQIADILHARGDLDEALRIHQEERLPVAQRMRDQSEIAHIRWSCARIRLARGGWDNGEAAVIAEELAESYQLSLQLGRVDAIGAVGPLFAQVLAATGQPDEALAVLDTAAAAYAKLGNEKGLAHVRALRERIGKASP